MRGKIITRRTLLKNSALATIAGALYLNFPVKLFGSNPDKKTKVILIREKSVLDDSGKINRTVIQNMLDDAVKELTGLDDTLTAWKNIVKPDDIVGIKSNKWSRLPTPGELEESIKTRIMEVGVPADKISIRDWGILNDPVFTEGTALINVRPMRTHDWAGVGSLIKNYILFTRKPSSYHSDTCADLATIWDLPMVKGKTRLNILVMLTPLFHGIGPHHFNKKYTWAYKGLILGFDPVAVDSVGVRIIQARRTEYFEEERPIKPPVKHIFLADTRHHLGTADPEKIDLVKLGWKEGILI
jgi:hypothetical protein